jgi:hypothetical protein
MTPSMHKAPFVSILIALAAPALAQPPTDAQRSAIRGACRGDYANVCANVPTGGKEALQCLQQHQSEVSTKCREALAPLEPPQAAPTTAAAAAAALPSSQPPASPLALPIRAAARREHQTVNRVASVRGVLPQPPTDRHVLLGA